MIQPQNLFSIESIEDNVFRVFLSSSKQSHTAISSFVSHPLMLVDCNDSHTFDLICGISSLPFSNSDQTTLFHFTLLNGCLKEKASNCICESVQFFIKSIRSTTISIHIDSTSSISDLKHLIYTHDGIPPCDIRLLHGGRELRDDVLLSGLDVDGSTITCLLRVLGGNPRKRKIPFHWWFGFSRSYEDGRAGEEGRNCHVLSEIEFDGLCPENWYSSTPLSDWKGIEVHSGNVLIDCLDI